MTERIWVTEDLSEVYSDSHYQVMTDEEKDGLVAFERVHSEQQK